MAVDFERRIQARAERKESLQQHFYRASTMKTKTTFSAYALGSRPNFFVLKLKNVCPRRWCYVHMMSCVHPLGHKILPAISTYLSPFTLMAACVTYTWCSSLVMGVHLNLTKTALERFPRHRVDRWSQALECARGKRGGSSTRSWSVGSAFYPFFFLYLESAHHAITAAF